MSIEVTYLPNFYERATESERSLADQLTNSIKETGNNLGASYAYVTKNKTGEYYPMTIQFHAHGGKFLARRTPRTVLLGR